MTQICRYLADEGHDVTLYLIDEYPHFHPYADSYKPLNFTIREYPLKKTEIVTKSRKELKAEFGGYDYLIGIEYAPAIAMRIGKPLNVFYSAATDLSHYPFSEYSYMTGSTWKTEEKYLSELQFSGIKNTPNISMNMAPLPIERALKRIGFKGRRFEALPYLYTRFWREDEVLGKSAAKSAFDKVRSAFDILIFHHIRHEWGDDTDEVHRKGNDKLFLALKNLKEKLPDRKVGLITFEYGNSQENSKALSVELGLEEDVTWFPVSNRKDYMYGISVSDICVGQLYHNMITYTSFAEYVVLKKPVIQWYRHDENVTSSLPFFAVGSQQELNDKLLFIAGNLNDESIRLKTESSFQWLETDNVKKPLKAILEDLKVSRRNLFFLSNWMELKFKMRIFIDKLIYQLYLKRIVNT